MDDKTEIIDWIYNKDQKNFLFPFVYEKESEIEIQQYLQKCFECFSVEQISMLKNKTLNPSLPATLLMIGKTLNEYESYKNKGCINDENKDLIQELKDNADKFIEIIEHSLGSQIEKYEKLKDFYSALSEMKCAIHFSSRDYFMKFIKESSKHKTPDLHIIKNNNNKIVEVKWLRTANNALNVQTENIQFIEELREIGTNNNVKCIITFNNHPYHSDFKPLTEEITKKIKSIDKFPCTFNVVGKDSRIDIKIELKSGSGIQTNIPFFDQLYRLERNLNDAKDQHEQYKKYKGFMESYTVLFLHMNKFMLNKGDKDYVENNAKKWLENQNIVSKILLFYEAPILISNGVYSLNDEYSVVF